MTILYRVLGIDKEGHEIDYSVEAGTEEDANQLLKRYLDLVGREPKWYEIKPEPDKTTSTIVITAEWVEKLEMGRRLGY